jgi:hypothetical protein
MQSPIAKWKLIEKTIQLVLLVFGGVALGFSIYYWGLWAVIPTALGLLCLALGFKITELLVAILSGVRKANPSAIAILFLFKLIWWGALFWGSKRAPVEWQKPFALGLGVFLLSLLIGGLRHYGLPKISEANDPREP